jgi:hypothetical protein
LVVSSAAEGAALRRCSANSFAMSNLVCARLDAADRTSIAQKQARVVMRAATRHPRGCGRGSIGRTCIATSFFVFVLLLNRPANESPKLRAALCARELSVPPRSMLLGELPVNRNRPFLKKVGHRQLDPCFRRWERQLPQPSDSQQVTGVPGLSRNWRNQAIALIDTVASATDRSNQLIPRFFRRYIAAAISSLCVLFTRP